MASGIVKHWNEDKGYGFIRPDDGGADLFAHISQVQDKVILQEGQRVRFDAGTGRNGRPAAQNVALL